MPQPIRMHQVRQILQFLIQGHSIRQVQRLTGLSRNTIRNYLARFKISGLSLEALLELDEQELVALIHPDAALNTRSGRTLDDRFEVVKDEFEHYAAQLNRRGVTRTLLWMEYREKHPNGYAYSQFCAHLAKYLDQRESPMVLPRHPGEILQVDFAGGQMSYIDQQTGEVISCPILVCTMPYSHFIYAQALINAKQEEFLSGLSKSLIYLGAVPQAIKADNMRIAVQRSNRYEPTFTQAMELFCTHYGCTALAARVKKPRDKASVEKAVDLAYKYIYAPLRNHTFYSLEQLNKTILEQVNKLNNRQFYKREGTRRELYQQDELPKMIALPAASFNLTHVTESKVQRNYHVLLGEDRCQYSVPYNLIGRRLRIIYNLETVEIYDGLVRVAVHIRSLRKNSYTTLAEHMPERHRKHQQYLGWDAATFEQRALSIGPNTQRVIKKILESRFFYEQTFNRCLGILRLADRYGKDRLENACKYLSGVHTPTYSIIANVLNNKLDLVQDNQIPFSIPEHDQIRGSGHYQ